MAKDKTWLKKAKTDLLDDLKKLPGGRMAFYIVGRRSEKTDFSKDDAISNLETSTQFGASTTYGNGNFLYVIADTPTIEEKRKKYLIIYPIFIVDGVTFRESVLNHQDPPLENVELETDNLGIALTVGQSPVMLLSKFAEYVKNIEKTSALNQVDATSFLGKFVKNQSEFAKINKDLNIDYSANLTLPTNLVAGIDIDLLKSSDTQNGKKFQELLWNFIEKKNLVNDEKTSKILKAFIEQFKDSSYKNNEWDGDVWGSGTAGQNTETVVALLMNEIYEQGISPSIYFKIKLKTNPNDETKQIFDEIEIQDASIKSKLRDFIKHIVKT